MKQIDLREGARRQHRAVALIGVIHCWMRGLDGLVFERDELLRLLGLKYFKLTRVEWLCVDFRDYFQFVVPRNCPDKKNSEGVLNSLTSLWVSRRRVRGLNSSPSRRSTQELLQWIPDGEAKIEVFTMWSPAKAKEFQTFFAAGIPAQADSINIDERLLASYLSLLSQGQISPRSLPSLPKTD